MIEIYEFQKQTLKKKEQIKIELKLKNGFLDASFIHVFQTFNQSKFSNTLSKCIPLINIF